MSEQRLEAGQQVVQQGDLPASPYISLEYSYLHLPAPPYISRYLPISRPDPHQVVQQGVAGDTFYAVLSGTFWLGAGVGLGLGLGSG